MSPCARVANSAPVRFSAFPAILMCSLLISWVPDVRSNQVFTEDVVIENTDPALIFDDTSTAADGFEYVIRGRDEFFSVRNDVLGRTHLYIDTAQQSIALGVNSSVTANSGAALGRNSSVSAENAIALGLNATASGDYGSAIGAFTFASGSNSVALGRGADASLSNTIAVGTGSSAGGTNNIAIGNTAQSSMTASIAIGHFTVATADFSAAFGYQANATANSGTALGFVTKALADRSTAIGFRAYADQPDTLILGAIAGVNGASAYSNVGVGTSNPIQAVDVERSGEAARFQLTSYTNEATQAPQFIQRRARGSSGAPLNLLNNDNLGLFSFRGYNGTQMTGSRATITVQAAGTWNGTSNPTRILFGTTPVGSTTVQSVLEITPDAKVKINGATLNVPDFVFEDDYELMPLAELRAFIDENGHLPGIPSAKEVNAGGLDLAGSQMGLLQKVEELTLYTLQQQSLIEAQRERIQQLEAHDSERALQVTELKSLADEVAALKAVIQGASGRAAQVTMN